MTIEQRFPTSKTVAEAKVRIDDVLGRDEVQPFLTSREWHGDVLYVTSPFGHGTLEVQHHLLILTLHLNAFGGAMKGRIESGFEKALKKIDS